MDIRLKTTVGGQFDFAAVKKALDAQGPLEPETEYVLNVHLAPAPGVEAAAPVSVPPASRSERARRAAADEG